MQLLSYLQQNSGVVARPNSMRGRASGCGCEVETETGAEGERERERG